MAIGGDRTFPSIETVLNLVRSLVLDDMAGATGTVGEGQIYVDNTTVSVTLSNFFNSSLRDLARELRVVDGAQLMRDNYLVLGLPPINSSLGVAAPNPATQVYLSHAGYFDGATMHPSMTLPQDLLQPTRVFERLNGSNGRFVLMGQVPEALTGVWQGNRFGSWEWREGRIYMHGATTTRDLRLRYMGTLVDLYTPGVNLATTYIPIPDCQDNLADKIVVKIARRNAPERLADAMAAEKMSRYELKNQFVKQKQGIDYETPAFGTESGPVIGG